MQLVKFLSVLFLSSFYILISSAELTAQNTASQSVNTDPEDKNITTNDIAASAEPASVTNQTNIADKPVELPEVSFPDTDLKVKETATNVFIKVLLSAPAPEKLKVSFNYHTEEDTALSGKDFKNTLGTLIFISAETQKQIAVPLIDDKKNESTESFNMVFQTAKNCRLLQSNVTVQIIDDDPLNTNDTVPDFEVETLMYETITPEDKMDQLYPDDGMFILVFCNLSNKKSLQILPEIEKIHDDLRMHFAPVYTVFHDSIRKKVWQHCKLDNKYTMPIICDTEKETAAFTAENIYPTLYIIDYDGIIRYKHLGTFSDFKKTIKQQVELIRPETYPDYK
ncbi:MAG TPA: Calx-beta domain-containing protein [Spirochaetota bacterium]|nr:Calx-beta domain-containing protein [Spirochaetota bacterium]